MGTGMRNGEVIREGWPHNSGLSWRTREAQRSEHTCLNEIQPLFSKALPQFENATHTNDRPYIEMPRHRNTLKAIPSTFKRRAPKGTQRLKLTPVGSSWLKLTQTGSMVAAMFNAGWLACMAPPRPVWGRAASGVQGPTTSPRTGWLRPCRSQRGPTQTPRQTR